MTRSAHTATEEAFAPFDLTTLTGLAGFFTAQAMAILPIERELDARSAERLLPDWPDRRRSLALQADLAALGLSLPVPIDTIALASEHHLFGALYVLEGSRLGGAMLKRIVAASAEPLVRATTGFLAHTPGPGAWRTFIARLDAVSLDEKGEAHLRQTALSTFAMFQKAARHVINADTVLTSEQSDAKRDLGDGLVGVQRA